MRHIFLEIIAIVVSSVIASVTFWMVTPDKMLEARIVIPILILILIILYGAIKYIFQLQDDLKNNNQIKLPKLKTIDGDYYIFESSEIFEPQSYCILYQIDKTKKKLALGIVETIIDSSHLLQVKILGEIDKEIQNTMLKNRDKIYLKPTITTLYIDKESIIQGVE